MRIRPLSLALLVFSVVTVACDRAPAMSPTDPTTVGMPEPLPAYRAHPLPDQEGGLFSTSGACVSCHTDMIDRAGNDVSIGKDWRAAIMANASRDPYWRATVRSEVLDHPALQAVIEDKCAGCHTPMARFAAAAANAETALLEDGVLAARHPRHAFAIDGVSCTVCHQIEDEGLGETDSFSGGFVIDTERPRGARAAYGPFPPVWGSALAMQRASGYWPVEGSHTGTSELCATCHTLYTPYVEESGEIAGTFPEQVPYLEWRHSDYPETHACPDCHMPPAEGKMVIARAGGGPRRSPFSQHRFIGGNAYVLKMLWAFGDRYSVTASSEHFERKVAQTLEQLQTKTAAITVKDVRVTESTLSFDVAVRTQTGHKFPTAFPSRRAWLHVLVEDGDGETIFESGAVNAAGFIDGNDNDADAASHEPHYLEITESDQVQIYEPILESVSGEVTTRLLRASGYRKDNRLLPFGFDKATAGDDFAVYGGAVDDADFEAGGDTVHYVIEIPGPQRPVSVTVELLYQSIGYRWAENLRGLDGEEIAGFIDAYDGLDNLPVVVDAISTSVDR